MDAPQAHILLVALMLVCGLGAAGAPAAQTAGAPALAASPEAGAEVEVDTQLRINLTTLLEGKTDKDRIDAAGLMLFNDKPAAREIVLDVLRRTDNPQARAAVCDALNPTRIWQKTLQNKEDFIKPLLAILTSEQDPEIAKRAAEATLIFGYGEVRQELEKAVADPSLSVTVRMNVIYALKRHPDREAVTKLISLLGSPEPAIVEAARAALVSVGLSAGPEAGAQQQMLAELKRDGVETFLRGRVIWQETRVRELEASLADWQKRLLTALGGWYDALADDAAKYAFLGQRLASSDPAVRSWALDKVQELRNAKGTLKLPELEPALSVAISDPSKQVRLKAARVLAKMGELNTSKPLLEQLRVEPDEQIKRELLVALGEACYAGSMPTAGRKVPEEVRRETLEWAVKFLNEPDPEKVRSGAAVIGKLLEQDGLKPQDVDRYLKALLDRYSQLAVETDPALRSYLLSAMAGLCTTRSTCRGQAVKLYGPSFDQALADKAEAVRLSAIDGCVNVDKPGAMRKLRENLAADASVPIRQKLVDLAGEIGGPQDLDWLAEKLGVAGEAEPAWQAMLKVFRGSDLTVLTDWVVKVEVLAAAGKLSVDQRIAFLSLVEQRAQSEKKTDLLKGVQASLAQLYRASNNFVQAAEYLKNVLAAAATEDERQRILSQLLQVYLGSSSMEQAAELICKYLSAKELEKSSGFVVKSVEEYLNDPKTTNSAAVLTALQQIKIQDPEIARLWQELLSRWTKEFAKAKKVEDGGRMND